MEDTWFSRDLPVLDIAVQICDLRNGGPAFVSEVVDNLEGQEVVPSPQEVRKAFTAIRPLFETVSAETDELGIEALSYPTPEARRYVGAWPEPHQLAERVVAELERQAEAETDPKKKSWLKSVIKGTGQAGREIAVDVMASVIKQQAGI